MALSIKKVQLEIQNRPELLIKIFHDCVDVAETIPLMDGQIGEIDYRSKSGFDIKLFRNLIIKLETF